MGGGAGKLDAEVPGIEVFFHACGVGLDQGENAKAMFVCHRGSTGFALFAAKAGVAEVDAVQVGKLGGVGWVGAERAELIG